jgi:predicted alpha/beta superfamily hydrolase
VHLPGSYTSTNQSYPVLYLLDGEGHFKYVSEMVEYLSGYDRNRIPEMIVIGIVNVDRGGDFTPRWGELSDGSVAGSTLSKTTGSGRFLQYIQQELIPYIDKSYRTRPYRILAGHSMGGLFAFLTKVIAPDLFQSTLLISPAIGDKNDKLLPEFTPFLRKNAQLTGKLFITLGNENSDKVDNLVRQLKVSAPKSFQWRYKKYEDENHFSVTYKSMYDGLKYIYNSWFFDFWDTARLTYKDIETHFQRFSKEFGYVMEPSEDFVNKCGYRLLRFGHVNDAIAIFEKNAERNPESFNVYDSLGEAYMVKGEKQLAISNYEKSLTLNPNNENGKEMLKKLKTKDNAENN